MRVWGSEGLGGGGGGADHPNGQVLNDHVRRQVVDIELRVLVGDDLIGQVRNRAVSARCGLTMARPPSSENSPAIALL